MLVLSRKTGEKIYIGEDVFVEVRRVSGNRVTLAINAPRSVRILRGELKEDTNAFEVLDDTEALDTEALESAKDTVIMKGEPLQSNSSVPEPHVLPQVEVSRVHAK